MYDAVNPSPVRIDAETPADAASVEALVLTAFGPGRFAKTAERLREQSGTPTGFVARDAGRVVGSVRLWPIAVDGRPALFLGPIAVAADCRRSGLGADLVKACLVHAATVQLDVLLVGDPPYFQRFGFVVAPEARLPGPVDQRRVMWLGEGEAIGTVGAA